MKIYTIEKSIKGDQQIVFRLKDSAGNTLSNRNFNPEELQKIRDNLYRIERIIKTRYRKR